MNIYQNASRSEEPTTTNGESSRQQTGVSQNGRVDKSTHAELSPGLAWSQQNLLSLDGGGIRGYWTLLVLEHLMKCIAQEEINQSEPNEQHHSFYPEDFPANVTQGGLDESERQRQESTRGVRVPTHDIIRNVRKYLPCHYFDYICGSSTGALIAIMLGRFRMPVWDCLREYEHIGDLIFGRPRLISQANVFIVPWEKYSAKALEQAFRKVTARRWRDHTTTSHLGHRTCRHGFAERKLLLDWTYRKSSRTNSFSSFVTTFAYERNKDGVQVQRLYRIRTYKKGKKGITPIHHQRTNTTLTIDEREYGSDWQIWQVARAATAAPMYFKELSEKTEMRKGKTTVHFSDGGFSQTNNPTYEGLAEVTSLHGVENRGAVVSIGTSRSKPKAGGKSIFKKAAAAVHIATDPEEVAKKVKDMDLPHSWRFNDENGIEVQLDDWKPNGYFTKQPGIKTLTKIKNRFREWALDEENGRRMQNCAEELVRRRRARIRDPVMWKIYATNASFDCPYDGCRNEFSEDYEALSKHLRDEHMNTDVQLRDNIDRATKMWQYQDAT